MNLVSDLKRQFAWRTLQNLVELREQDERPASYLFCETPDSNRYLFSVNNLPSQFMRKQLSVALGNDDWNWRSAGREDRLLNTTRQLSERFEGASKSGHQGGV
jgi:hypothetical protein